jgi:hypothetical protein
MAKNSISQRSDKGVHSNRIITVQPEAGNIKGVGGQKNFVCSSKFDLSELATELTHERIAEQARVIWQNRGCKSGEDERNWSEAEAQLRAEMVTD